MFVDSLVALLLAVPHLLISLLVRRDQPWRGAAELGREVAVGLVRNGLCYGHGGVFCASDVNVAHQ